MPRSSWACEPQLLSLRVWSLCSATGEAATVRGPRTAMKSGPRSPQLERALAQKRRPNTTKNKYKNKKINKRLLLKKIYIYIKKQKKVKTLSDVQPLAHGTQGLWTYVPPTAGHLALWHTANLSGVTLSESCVIITQTRYLGWGGEEALMTYIQLTSV